MPDRTLRGDDVLQVPEAFCWYYTETLADHVRIRCPRGVEWHKPKFSELVTLLRLVAEKKKSLELGPGHPSRVEIDVDGCYLLDEVHTAHRGQKQYFGLVRDEAPMALQVAVPALLKRASTLES
eukprot:TRINITY_DN65977_c0_g1_i1.p1 TRINITY_DN65977_c0_g1~~TRINITY_DN65977_c0_g1_i1.p1  ORF type:complete len:145 (-),score=14.49 TRINITY_DN65977_c0_g1_i1:80-451(-)